MKFFSAIVDVQLRFTVFSATDFSTISSNEKADSETEPIRLAQKCHKCPRAVQSESSVWSRDRGGQGLF